MTKKIPVGLVGVTGYTGMELVRILLAHPSIELVCATSRSEAGKTLAQLYPFLSGTTLGNLIISQPDVQELAKNCELVFLAVPHKTAMELADALLQAGSKVVDLSADFRLRDQDVYEQWYAVKHTRSALLGEAVYGLPEFYEENIQTARLVANPGCYPTSALLGIAPALKAQLIEPENIVIDSKSGTTGAGRKATLSSAFCEVSDSFRAYSLPSHRHTPEIEQELSLVAGQEIRVSFNTHLLPVNRGILSTIYTHLCPNVDEATIRSAYETQYGNKPWVRILPQGKFPETRWVRGTMYCDIALVVDPRTGRLIILSAIDNLCRGASGQAVANANCMLGLKLMAGLNFAPLMP